MYGIESVFKKHLLNENKGACSGIGTDPKEAGKLRMEPHEKGNTVTAPSSKTISVPFY